MQLYVKRLLAALLVITMFVGMLPGSIFANLVNAYEAATLKAQIVRTEVGATADEATRDEATDDEATSEGTTDDEAESADAEVTKVKRAKAKKVTKKVKAPKNVATPDEPVATPDEPVATPDDPVATPDEPIATPDQPEKPGEDEKDETEYAYELFLWVNDTRIVSNLSVIWKLSDGTAQGDDCLIITSKEKSVTAVVEYDGIILTVNSSEDNSEVITFGPKEVEWRSNGIIIGSMFDLPSDELQDGQSLKNTSATPDEATRDEATRDEATRDESASDSVIGAQATSDEATSDEATSDEATPDEAYYEKIVKGQFDTVITSKGCTLYRSGTGYYATGIGTVTVTQTWKGTSGTVYAERSFDRTVRHPAATFYVDGTAVTEASEEWYCASKTVCVRTESVGSLISTEFLPDVLVNEEKAAANWEKDGDVYEMVVSVSTSSTIDYAKGLDVFKSLNLGIDTVNPTVTFKHSYFDVYQGDSVQVVKFETTVGESGYESIIITGSNGGKTEVDPSMVKDNVCEVTIENGDIEPVMITVKNKAGASASTCKDENDHWYPVQPDLTIEFSTDAAPLPEDPSYLPKENEMTVVATIAGVTKDGDYDISEVNIVALDQNGQKINSMRIDSEIAVPLRNGLQELTIEVTDEMGRTETSSFETKYYVDLEAPVIKSNLDDLKTENGSLNIKNEVQFKLWIEEDILAEDYVNGSSYVKYTLNGKEDGGKFNENGEFSIDLSDGDVLSNVKAVAYDLTGNQSEEYKVGTPIIVDASKPTIKLWLSNNVKGLFRNGEDNFAVIDMNESAIIVFVEVQDGKLNNGDNNLDLDTMNGFMKDHGWTDKEDQIWTKTLSVDDFATGSATFTFKAVDMAGNESTDELALTFGSASNGSAQNVLPISYDGSNYTFALNLDRRAPDGADDGKPTIWIEEEKVSGTDIYNTNKLDTKKLTVVVNDFSVGTKDSGIQKVTAEIDHGLIANVGEVDSTGNCTIEIPVPDNLEAHNVKLTIQTLDNVGNCEDYEVFFNVDTKAPEIHVTKELARGAEHIREADGIDFYNGEVEYTVSIKDMYLNAENGIASLKIVYQDGTVDEVNLFESAAYPYSRSNPQDQYVYSFTVEDQKLVKEITLVAKDNAGNCCNSDASNLTIDDEDGLTSFRYDGDGKWIYTGNGIAVDMTAPEIVVTKKPAEMDAITKVYPYNDVNSYNDVDYYNGAVTYQFVVTDRFLTANAGEAQLVVGYQGGRIETVDLLEKTLKKLPDHSYQYTYEHTVVNSEMVESMTLVIRDNANNLMNKDKSNLSVNDKEGLTTFDYKEGKWHYTGNKVVVDTEAPEVKVEFSKNVTNFYRNGNTIYVICAPSINGESGIPADGKAETVTVTITAKDRNLSLDNGVDANPEYGFVWTGTTEENNPDNVVTFTAEGSTVAPDGTRTFVIDVGIIDLAGNAITGYDTDDYGNGLTMPNVESGRIKFVTSLDRRRPTSQELNDTSAPTIEVTPSVTPNTTAADRGSLDLFSGDFSFNVTINDGVLNEHNSGVYSVQWAVTDVNGAVTSNEVVLRNEEYLETLNINIPVSTVAGRESNEVKLNIVATDNVGNAITFEKIFAVDTLAPRVTITQSNHDVSHEKYFKAQQVVTVRIEDLNFESTASTVNTQVSFNGWTNVSGNVYETVLTYNRDGDYTFAMASTDRANNAATIDYTTGLTALQDFVVDMTAPVIEVHYTDSGMKGLYENVEYYDAKRILSLTITEHNFAANEVTANVLMGGVKKDTLNATGNRGDVHNYGYTFEDGNKYSVFVSYTDKAGNRAVLRGSGTVDYSSPRFTVDSKKPEIVMTKGDLSYGELNIIDGELSLGFTITDAEGNMSENVIVQLQFQDRNFGQSTVEQYYTVSRSNSSAVYVDFSDIPADLATDGIYSLKITATDHSGNMDELDGGLIMSVNRYGSTFTTDDPATREFLVVGPNEVIYRQNMDHDLVIKEINPNVVYQDSSKTAEGSLITVSANGKSVTLTAGADYDLECIKHEQGSGCWYEYVYTIYKGVFHEDGELVNADFTISFYSEDAAGHKNANELNEGGKLTQEADGSYSGRLSFTLDNQPPVVTLTGAVNNKQYRQEYISIRIDLADNTPTDIKIYVGDELVQMLEAGATAPNSTNWYAWDQSAGCFKLNLAEARGYQDVRVVVTDEAGNETPETLRIQVSSSFFDLYIHNTWALVGTAVGLVALITVIVLLLSKKKKKAAASAS